MAQHDYVVANQSGASFRADLNNALAAIASQNSGANEPSVTYAYMHWADTTTGLFKIRNAANSGWITLYQLDGEWSAIPLENGSATAPPLYFKDSGTDTGIFSPGADQFGIATAGLERVKYGTNEVVFNDVGANYDFRVEGDTKANLLLVDASADSVSIDGDFSVTGDATVGSLNSGSLAGLRNRIINGGMVVDQRRNGGSLSSGINALTYSVDRWYVYALGAAVTAQRVGSSAARYESALRLTGAAGNTFAMTGQRIEVSNSLDLANQLSGGGGYVSLSFAAATSASKTITWKIFYATAANNFTTKTEIANGTQATTPALTDYLAPNILLPAVATTGLSIEFSVDNLTSGTFDLTGVQLEPGTVSTPFERRPIGTELALCQRYYETGSAILAGYSQTTIANVATVFWKQTKRVTPTLGYGVVTAGNVSVYDIRNATIDKAEWYAEITANGGFTWNGTYSASAEL